VTTKPKIAIFFRYGAEEHPTFLPALPALAADLSRHYEVHHFGMKSPESLDPALRETLVVHHFPPCTVRRKSTFDKFFKTAIWMLGLPWLCLYCRLTGFRAVFVDEAVPLTALILRVFFGRRVAFTIHDFFVNIYFMPRPALRYVGKLIHAIDMACWRRLDLIIARVHATRAYLQRHGFTADRIAVVHDACDLERFAPRDRETSRSKWGFSASDVVLVHHGIMHPNKGNDRIVRAMAQARDAMPNLRLLLVGDGPQYSELRQLATSLGLNDVVRFTGWLPSLDDIAVALNASDIGLAMRIGQDSDHFHITSTLVHNMACGLPILAARLEGYQDIVQDGRDALLFDAEVGTEFLSQLERLYNDSDLRQRLGQISLDLAHRHFHPPRVGGQLSQLLHHLAERG